MQFFHLVVCAMLLISGEGGSTSAPKEEMDHYDLMDQTNHRFDAFQSELKWYFSNLDTEVKNVSHDNQEYLTQQKDELKQAVEKATQIFLDLRMKFRDIIFAKYGNYPDTQIELAAALSEATGWYTTFVEELLFPRGWEETLDQHADKGQQNKPVLHLH